KGFVTRSMVDDDLATEACGSSCLSCGASDIAAKGWAFSSLQMDVLAKVIDDLEREFKSAIPVKALRAAVSKSLEGHDAAINELRGKVDAILTILGRPPK